MAEWAPATYFQLLHEARDLLWHKRDHSPSGRQDCPGCVLAAKIDAALGADHSDGPGGADA